MIKSNIGGLIGASKIAGTASAGNSKIYDIGWSFVIAVFLVSLLPASPFQLFIDNIETLNSLVNMAFVNWFIPFGTCIAIGEAWLVAVAVFYGYSYALRIVSVIGG